MAAGCLAKSRTTSLGSMLPGSLGPSTNRLASSIAVPGRAGWWEDGEDGGNGGNGGNGVQYHLSLMLDKASKTEAASVQPRMDDRAAND